MQINEFKEVLSEYHPAGDVIKKLQNTPLILITSVTSAGKNAVIDRLVKTGKYFSLISDTTRPRRVNDGILEKNGQDYWFVTEKQFYDGLKNGRYLEAAIVHKNHLYGTSIEELEKAKSNNKVAITDIDIVGAENIKQLFSNVKAVFLLPPNFEEWMRRLNHRGKMSKWERQRRLKTAEEELYEALKKDYFVFFVNDDLSNVASQIDEFVLSGKIDKKQQAETVKIAKSLLKNLDFSS